MNVNGRDSFRLISYISTMRIRKQTLTIIVALLVISLGGLVALQYALLTDVMEQRDQTFHQNVFKAMSSVAERLETKETAGKVFKMIVNSSSTNTMKFLHVDVDSNIPRKNTRDSIVMVAGVRVEPPVWMNNDTIRYNVEKGQKVTLRVYDAVGKQDTVLVDTFKDAGVYAVCLDNPKYSKGEYFYKLLLDNTSYTMRISNGLEKILLPGNVSYERKQQLVGKVIDNLSVTEHEPIERRVQPEVLDSLIHIGLSEVGITIPYAFAVTGEVRDSLKILQPANYQQQLRATEFKSRLFPNDFLFSGNQLLLYFPEQRMFVLKQLWLQVSLTVLLTLLLVFCFTYTVRTIIKQKDFSVRLVEFINNMTHEFKTPISTISVAAETIMRDDVVEQIEKVKRYGTVIREENQRMKTQVDKILQMAVLEEGDFELKLSQVDVHELIATAVKNIALQVEAKQGAIRYEFEATQSIISADVVHCSNIIHNILDNATKYSPDAPEIVVTTKNVNDLLFIEVSDHGIGIGKEELKKVFDKYYRVPTGNRHDVKGFGLGLSYVKLMMIAHGGDVGITSEQGKGTTVTLTFRLPDERIE